MSGVNLRFDSLTVYKIQQVGECEYDFQNYALYVCFKSELLEPKKQKSPTCCNFEIFDQDPQIDMKFWNP